MGDSRVQVDGKSSSTLTPGFKPEEFSLLKQRYQDRVEVETTSPTAEKQFSTSGQTTPTPPPSDPPPLSHSFGRMTVLPIQAKLTIGQPNDKYEQEADRVAEQVMRMPDPRSPAAAITRPVRAPVVQRVCEECEEKEILRTKPLVSQISPLIQKMNEPTEEDEEKLQTKPLTCQFSPLVQRMGEPTEEEEEEEEQTVRTKENPGQATSVTSNLEARINTSKGSGQPLPEQTRAFIESRFGYDFSQVRVHADGEAGQLNQELRAQAFTHGQDVYFGAGKYSPESEEGKQLLAHELTHVVQQTSQKRTNTNNYSRIQLQPTDEEDKLINEKEPEELENEEEETFEEPFEEANALRERSNELERLILETWLEYSTAYENEDLAWQELINLKLEVSRCRREKLLIDTYFSTALGSTVFGSEGLEEDADTLIERAYLASQSEEETLLALQGREETHGNLSEIVNDVLLTMPELFPEYTLGLYQSAVEEFLSLTQDYRLAFEADLASLTRRPIEEIIPDFVWMLKNRSSLQAQAAMISFFNQLDSEAPVFLEKRESNSTSIGIENIQLRLNEHHTNWAELLHPNLEESLSFLYPALENWNFYKLYAGLAERMDFLSRLTQVTYERLNQPFSMPDVIADVERTYQDETRLIISSVGGSGPSQVGLETRREGFNVIFNEIENTLNAWVQSLSWYEKIREGFSLYDVLGEIGTQLKALTTPSAIAMMVGFIAFLIAIQGVPFANIVVDAILITLGGIDIIKGIYIFGRYFDRASEATTFRNLYFAAQDLKGGGEAILNLLFELIGLAASRAIRSYARYRNTQRFNNIDDIADLDDIRRHSEIRRAFEEARAGQRALSRWEESLNPETRRLLEADPDLRRFYAEMDPQVRQLLTRCNTPCIPTNPRPSSPDISRIKNLLTRLSLPGNHPGLTGYLHRNRHRISEAIEEFDNIATLDELDQLLLRAARSNLPGGQMPRGVPWTGRSGGGMSSQAVADAILELRVREGLLRQSELGRNVAAARVRVDGVERIIARSNRRRGLHSEEVLFSEVIPSLRREGKTVEVLELLTERVPCTTASCRSLISLERSNSPGMKVFLFTRKSGAVAESELARIYGL